MHVLLNSPGGCVYSCLQMMNSIEDAQERVNLIMYANGFVGSSAAFVFMAAHQRRCLKNSFLLFHHVRTTFDDEIKHEDMHDELASNQKIHEHMYHLLHKQTNRTWDISDIRENMKNEIVFDYKECKKLCISNMHMIQ